ncbi:transposase [Mesorhizobium mediterraneum]|uniref:transposase n=1 Tax=Mesorhizobium mediterraneum TaxID=43617 RepID=UPI001AEE6369|nr:transposase [Mesorhizobium mediterraneum]
MGQITLLTGPERRRRWNEEERRQILEEAFSPGACVTQVARRHDVSTALIYTWRRKLCQPDPDPCFTEAVVSMKTLVSQGSTTPLLLWIWQGEAG